MQQQFSQALFSTNELEQEDLLNDIKGHSLAERTQRLNVYRNNVYVSLMDALGEIFPVCKQVVGDAFFNAMARQYVDRHPPRSAILSEYGDQFSEFVSHFFAAQSLPYLASLCDLEYRLLQMTHNAEPTHLSLSEAQQRLSQANNPDALQLLLYSQCELLSYPYAVGQLYLAHKQPQLNLKQLQLQQADHLLIAKSGLYGCIYPLNALEFEFIKALKENPSLGQALPENESFDLGQTLAKLMTWEVFSDIYES
ncbi:DNA-binding domain-containing protein [Marinomonas ostreistagni]|uniref:DNA-binding domain-containing protein n=1 Tax=Marinomonas ostreistagni TaxID=359209 RepID=A0ABS0ZBN9_9GAMM|nr:DNA-binding domain-containing protein [Marinomonas ostreistagni]MBJ7551065.1 putative DNA-binding domain-containing protein [Marinomonas ostreistagni]